MNTCTFFISFLHGINDSSDEKVTIQGRVVRVNHHKYMYGYGHSAVLYYNELRNTDSIIVKKPITGCKVDADRLILTVDASKEIEDCPSLGVYEPLCRILRFPGK